MSLPACNPGKLKIIRKPVDVNEVIGQCRELFSVQAENKGVKIKVDLEPSITVLGDADRLEQLLSNLLDNAIKNSPSGSEVRVSSYKLSGDYIEIKIADSGPGIPPEQLPHVFERFYQVTGVRTGVGLGLAIAREIALAHGRTIEAKSEPGEGAEFVVRLPTVDS